MEDVGGWQALNLLAGRGCRTLGFWFFKGEGFDFSSVAILAPSKLFLELSCNPCYSVFQVVLRPFWSAAARLPPFLFVARIFSRNPSQPANDSGGTPNLPQFRRNPTHCDYTLLEPSLPNFLVSVGNKGLITPLESALTDSYHANLVRIRTYKNTGEGPANGEPNSMYNVFHF